MNLDLPELSIMSYKTIPFIISTNSPFRVEEDQVLRIFLDSENGYYYKLIPNSGIQLLRSRVLEHFMRSDYYEL